MIPLLIVKSLSQVTGNGYGSVVARSRAQPAGHYEPVEVGADTQSQGDPYPLDKTAGEDGSRKSEKEPAGHIRCPCRNSGGNGTEGSASDNKVFVGIGFFHGYIAHSDHKKQVQSELEVEDHINRPFIKSLKTND